MLCTGKMEFDFTACGMLDIAKRRCTQVPFFVVVTFCVCNAMGEVQVEKFH